MRIRSAFRWVGLSSHKALLFCCKLQGEVQLSALPGTLHVIVLFVPLWCAFVCERATAEGLIQTGPHHQEVSGRGSSNVVGEQNPEQSLKK